MAEIIESIITLYDDREIYHYNFLRSIGITLTNQPRSSVEKTDDGRTLPFEPRTVMYTPTEGESCPARNLKDVSTALERLSLPVLFTDDGRMATITEMDPDPNYTPQTIVVWNSDGLIEKNIYVGSRDGATLSLARKFGVSGEVDPNSGTIEDRFSYDSNGLCSEKKRVAIWYRGYIEGKDGVVDLPTPIEKNYP